LSGCEFGGLLGCELGYFFNRGLVMRLNVSTNVLRALVDFLDSANSRFALGSVRVVGSEGSDKVSLVATDGRILAHLELPCDVLSCDVDFGILKERF
jgi:hypothetical protein